MKHRIRNLLQISKTSFGQFKTNLRRNFGLNFIEVSILNSTNEFKKKHFYKHSYPIYCAFKKLFATFDQLQFSPTSAL